MQSTHFPSLQWKTLAQGQGTKTPSHTKCGNVVLTVTHKTDISRVRRHLCHRYRWLRFAPSGRYLGLCCAEQKGLKLGPRVDIGKKSNTMHDTNINMCKLYLRTIILEVVILNEYYL